MAELKHGIDVIVCNQCGIIKPKFFWKGGKCPNCGSESGTVRGKYSDQRIYIDGFLACGDRSVWADWAKDGFLVGKPQYGLEKTSGH